MSVCPSQADALSERLIELVFDSEVTLGLSYIVLEGNSGNSTNKGAILWNFVPNSNLADFSSFFATARRSMQVSLTMFM